MNTPMANFVERSLHYSRVREFMILAKQDDPTNTKFCITPGIARRKLRAKLILEEALETVEALGFRAEVNFDPTLLEHVVEIHECAAPDLVEIVDGCCDLKVVTTGCLIDHHIPDEFVQDLIDVSNLGKFGEGHSFREDGKLIKPANWKAPDIGAYLKLLENLNDYQ